MAKKQALGRGLGALLSDASTDITSNLGIKENLVGNIAMLKISQIDTVKNTKDKIGLLY